MVFYGREQSTRNLGQYREKMLLEFAESGCPIFRATTPLSRGQLRSKGHGKLSIHFGATQETIETIFRIFVFLPKMLLEFAEADDFQEIQDDLQERNIEPEQFGANYLHVDVQRHRMDMKRDEEKCVSKFRKVKMYAKRFS